MKVELWQGRESHLTMVDHQAHEEVSTSPNPGPSWEVTVIPFLQPTQAFVSLRGLQNECWWPTVRPHVEALLGELMSWIHTNDSCREKNYTFLSCSNQLNQNFNEELAPESSRIQVIKALSTRQIAG